MLGEAERQLFFRSQESPRGNSRPNEMKNL
jgi:hypothetical protein